MVHQHFSLPLMVFTEIRCLKNIFINLVTLSIPKIAKNGQKVPILANMLHWPDRHISNLSYCEMYSEPVFDHSDQ